MIMTNNPITQLKLEIDSIKEYLDAELCKKCEEMYNRLQECQSLLERLSRETTESETA